MCAAIKELLSALHAELLPCYATFSEQKFLVVAAAVELPLLQGGISFSAMLSHSLCQLNFVAEGVGRPIPKPFVHVSVCLSPIASVCHRTVPVSSLFY